MPSHYTQLREKLMEQCHWLRALTVVRVSTTNRPKIKPLSPMAKKAMDDAIKRFNLEGHKNELIAIASGLAALNNQVYIESDDVNDAYILYSGDYK